MTSAFSKIDQAAADIVSAIYGPVAYPEQAEREALTLAIMRKHGVHEDLIALVLHRVMAHFEERLVRIYTTGARSPSSDEAA